MIGLFKRSADGKRGSIYRPKRKNFNAWYLLLIILIAISGTSQIFALDPQKTINQYGHNIWLRQSGLPANAINVGLQAHDGYLWLGTSAGLFRFDGVNFNPVVTNPLDNTLIETISTLCMSRDSGLWVGTTFSGLRRIQDGKVFIYGANEGFLETQIRVLLESRTGHLWIGTSYGLFRYSQGQFVNIPISPNFITSIAEDSSGKIWVGTHLGVRIFDDVQAKQIDSITTTNGLSHNITTCIFADHEANMWIGTIDGLNCFKDNVIKVYRGADGLSNNHITAICEDKDKNLWFGTYKGLSRLSHNKWARMTSADGLTHDHVLSIMEDYEGSLWVCTLEGLNRFKDVNITSYTTRDGLTSDNLSSIAETPDGSLYFLSDVDGTITQLKDGKFKTYSTSVGTAYVARDGSLWIGQTGLLINIKNGQLKRYTAQTGFPNLWISAITEDDKSLILYVNGIGIRRFVNGQIRPYLMKDGKQYPSTEYIVCFYSKPGGVLWIGATHGLTKIENGESKVFLKANGLAGDWVNAIFEDQRGSLWICSPRDGLTHYKDGKFTIFTTKIGLFTDEIYCVLCDNQGDLWLSSPRGIGHVKRKEIDDYESGKIKSINTQVYVTADGMKSDECFGGWQPAGWKTHDGRLWFATKKGAVMIDPKAFKRNKLQPPVLIDKVVADQQIVPLGSYASLKPGIGKLEFHYTALSFLVPERVLFKYKLEGYDQDWVEARTQRVAYYMNLPPGNYQFQVMACNNDGVWNKTGASFAFRLEPHFYETYWFYGIVLIAFGGIVFGIIRLRIWRLVKKEKELQVRIQEALANIKTLSGLIPICASCKKIRDDRGYWDQLEEYIQSRSEVTFSHGICPDCVEKLYPGLYKAKKNP